MVLFANSTCADISGSQQECGTLCSACTQHPNNSYTCDICAPGAVLKSGVCVSCPEHCAQCSVSELGVCTSCLPGYYFVASSKSCSPCNQTHCISCNELACLSCASGYMLSPTLECMRTCMSPCATCSSTDPSSCTSCIAGFKYNTDASQNCEPDRDCNSNGTCTNCPFGFALSIDTVNFVSSCVQCGANCARCNPTSGNEGVCLSCFDGSFLEGNNCNVCPSNCMKCINSGSCLMCA